MIEILIVWAIILVAVFYVGRRLFLQFKRAIDKNSTADCGGGCSCCSVTGCNDNHDLTAEQGKNSTRNVSSGSKK